MLCVLAAWREKFMGPLRVADVSRKGCQPRKLSGQEARRPFPGLASWRWILHADCLPSVLSAVISSILSAVGPAKAEGPAKEAGLRIWPQMDTAGHTAMLSVKFCEFLWLKTFMRRTIVDCSDGLGTNTGFPLFCPPISLSQFLLFRHHSPYTHHPLSSIPIKVNQS
jgi:hypothetical protein